MAGGVNVTGKGQAEECVFRVSLANDPTCKKSDIVPVLILGFFLASNFSWRLGADGLRRSAFMCRLANV